MDKLRIAKMADKLAADENNEPLIQVDMAVDQIIDAIQAISEQLPKVETQTPEEEAAKKTINDLVETAITPYMVDIAKELDKFEGE